MQRLSDMELGRRPRGDRRHQLTYRIIDTAEPLKDSEPIQAFLV
jgi:hypothetical protein